MPPQKRIRAFAAAFFGFHFLLPFFAGPGGTCVDSHVSMRCEHTYTPMCLCVTQTHTHVKWSYFIRGVAKIKIYTPTLHESHNKNMTLMECGSDNSDLFNTSNVICSLLHGYVSVQHIHTPMCLCVSNA